MSADEPRGPQPPHDAKAEQCVLGAALIGVGIMGEILATGLEARDFYRPAHELIWEALCGLDEVGKPIDAVTVMNEMNRRGTMAKAGGPVYLHTLIAAVPSPSTGAFYARIVTEKAILRRLVSAGVRITQLGYSDGDIDEALSGAAAELSEVGADSTPQSINAAEAIEELIARKEAGPVEAPRGWRTGYYDLDQIVLRMLPQQLVLVAARPSVGKSVSLRDMARHMALRQNARVLMHSMEMSTEEVTSALASAESGVTLLRLKDDSCALGIAEQDQLATTYARFAGAYLHIDERESLSLQQLRASVRRHKPDVVFVDYVQLMRAGRRTESRYAEVSEVARGLKNLAKSEKVLIIAAAQLKRDAANRRPAMDDLKESGELEQAADTIILIHREDMLTREIARAGEADFIVAKQRSGERKDALLGAQLHYGRFVSPERYRDDPAPSYGQAS